MINESMITLLTSNNNTEPLKRTGPYFSNNLYNVMEDNTVPFRHRALILAKAANIVVDSLCTQ